MKAFSSWSQTPCGIGEVLASSIRLRLAKEVSSVPILLITFERKCLLVSGRSCSHSSCSQVAVSGLRCAEVRELRDQHIPVV